MKILFSYIFYYIGDLCCKLHLFNLYQKCMKLSTKLDTKDKVWRKK